jgi:2,3-bisphosphoglycerate-independent phosphoglycerate mutase
LIDFAVKEGIKDIRIHCFTDGRDSPPDSGLGYIEQIENKIQDVVRRTSCDVKIATVMGRYYAMDRDKRWDRIEKAYSAIVDGVGKKCNSAVEAVQTSYKEGVTDEFIVPVVIGNNKIKDDDSVIFFNFRADRARQLTRVMTDAGLVEFKRRLPRLSSFVTMTQYDEKFTLPVVFPPERMKNIFGEIIANKGLAQLRIAETEKYAHVTYFFNGGEEKTFKNEDRCLIPSPRDVPTYDKKPQMSAFEVTDEVVKRINSDKYDVIILNFANPDMVGHTGILEAAVKAVEAVDICVGRILEVILQKNGAAIIISDHGNCEEMIDNRGEPQTAHTTDLVPFVLVGNGYEKIRLKTGGALCDVAPTILELLKIKKPAEMTGSSLIDS